jgi:hypothetical protein
LTKTTCPTCESDEFMMHDEKRGQCFSAKCGLRTVDKRGWSSQATIFERIYAHFHQDLLALGVTAYLWLIETHKIHPALVAHSMVGSVPKQFAVSDLVVQFITAARERLDRLQRRGPGHPTRDQQAALEAAQDELNGLQQLQVKLERSFDSRPGWLVYFWTAPTHEVVKMTLVDPAGQKDLTIGSGGIFNHQLFPPTQQAQSTAHLRGHFIGIQTPLDNLVLQTLAAKQAEDECFSPQLGYLWSGALGDPVSGTSVRVLTRKPILYVPATVAGTATITQLRQEVNLHSFTPPGSEGVAEWISGAGYTPEIWTALNGAFDQRVLKTRPYENVQLELDRIRDNNRLRTYQVERLVGNNLLADLQERGDLYFDGVNPYVFLRDTQEVIPVDLEHDKWKVLAHGYGIVPTDALYKSLGENIYLEALESGIQTEVYTFSHYDATRHILYLFDLNNHVYRITPEDLERVPNGTDGHLFVQNAKWSPFELNLEAPRENLPSLNDVLLQHLKFAPGELSQADLQHLFILWVLAMFFPELFPTKLILAMIGPMGSGKTAVLRFLGQLLFGPGFDVTELTNDSRDLDAAITDDFLVVADNADRKISWLADKLAVVATGGTIKRRAYYSTNKKVEFPIKACMAITSRTPYFRREDVADRLLPMHVHRFGSFNSMNTLQAEVQRKRPEVMMWIACMLQKILGALRDHEGEPFSTSFRMADYAEFVTKVSKAMGYAGNAEELLGRLSRAQMAFGIQDEPLIALLDNWLSTRTNVGREIATGVLFDELFQSAIGQPELHFPFRNPQEFGLKLSDLSATLVTLYQMQERMGRSHMRCVKFNSGPLPDTSVSADGQAA